MNEINIYYITYLIWQKKILLFIVGILLFLSLALYNYISENYLDLKIKFEIKNVTNASFNSNEFFMKYNIILTKFFKGETVSQYAVSPQKNKNTFKTFFYKEFKKKENENIINNLKLKEGEKENIRKFLNSINNDNLIKAKFSQSISKELKNILRKLKLDASLASSNFLNERYNYFYSKEIENYEEIFDNRLSMFKIIKLDDKVLNLVEIDKNVFISLFGGTDLSDTISKNIEKENKLGGDIAKKIENNLTKEIAEQLKIIKLTVSSKDQLLESFDTNIRLNPPLLPSIQEIPKIIELPKTKIPERIKVEQVFATEIKEIIGENITEKLLKFKNEFEYKKNLINAEDLAIFSYEEKNQNINLIKSFIVLYFLIIFIILFYSLFFKSYEKYKK